MLTDEDKNAFKGYSDWVEGKMMTEGHIRLMENTLGLMGEAGEVAEKIKKSLRDGATVNPDDIMKELGDVAFYVTGLANFFGGSLATTLVMNMDKLESRAKRGTLKGSGDNR
jgi:NTP pyrophosphatase (non-canonical NTP hydrolase)